MSDVVKFVDRVVGDIPVISDAWEATKDFYDFIWKEMYLPVFEFAFSLLGITDQDILVANSTTVRIIDENAVISPVLKSVLATRASNLGVIEELKVNLFTARRLMSAFYRGGGSYIDGYPSSALIQLNLPDTAYVESILQLDYPEDVITVVSTDFKKPSLLEWANWYVQENEALSYDAFTNTGTFTIDGVPTSRTMWSVSFNAGTNKVEADFSTYDVITVRTYTKVTITATEVWSTNPVTLVGYDVTTVTEVRTEETHTLVPADNETVIVSTNEVVTFSATYPAVGVTETFNEDEDVVTEEVFGTPLVIAMDPSPNVYQYIIKYTINSSPNKIWVYNPADGTYPELNSVVNETSELELFPIIEIRSNKTFITDSTAPDAAERVSDAKQMLKHLGIGLDAFISGIADDNPDLDNLIDTFVHFGISPYSTKPIMSRVLFRALDYIVTANYENGQNSTLNTDDYSEELFFSVSEGKYNYIMTWTASSKEVIIGSIGSVGTYTHSVDGETIIANYQDTATTYIRCTFVGVTSATSINSDGKSTVVTMDLSNGRADKGFFIPLSFYFVDGLTPLEQFDVFTDCLVVSFFAGEIVHLEYYETPMFGVFLFVAAVVYFAFTLDPYITLKAFLYQLAIAAAASYALKFVLESNAPDWLKAIAVVVYVVVMFYVGGGKFDTFGLKDGVAMASHTLTALNMYMGTEVKNVQSNTQDLNTVYRERSEDTKEKTSVFAKQDAMLDTIVTMTNGRVPSIDEYYYLSLNGMCTNYDNFFMVDDLYNYDMFLSVKP